MNAMRICDFFSDIATLDSATHYRSQENGKDKPGPISKIIKRDPCPCCGRTIMLSTDTGVNATFVTRHRDCALHAITLKDDTA